MITLHHGNSLEVLQELGKFDMVFADPPDNIDLGYEGFEDLFDNYYDWFGDMMAIACYSAPIVWISFNAKHLAMVGKLVDLCFPRNHRFFMQTFTFGNNQRKDFTNGFRPLLRIMRNDAHTYPDSVYVPSWRQLNGDPRASDKGKMPDDVWDFPRVTGNSKQRRKWSPTQLHEGLYKRAIDFSTKPGARIVDMFGGSGTMARVAGDTHDVHIIEVSEPTIKNIQKEHQCELYSY